MTMGFHLMILFEESVFLLLVNEFVDGFGNGAVGCMGAVFVLAIYLLEFAVFGDDLQHPGVIQATAIAADKMFLFHAVSFLGSIS